MSTYPHRPKVEAFSNAVDVVVRLHSPTDQAPKLRHLRVLAHVQLDDVPRTPIQLSVEGEFRQHDGVVTMMMFYRRRASPKHYEDMTKGIITINGDYEKSSACAAASSRCRCQNRRISGRGSRTVRLRLMVTGDGGPDVYPGSGPLYGGNTLFPA